jgi:hypothetical protein
VCDHRGRRLWRRRDDGHAPPGLNCHCGIYGISLPAVAHYVVPYRFRGVEQTLVLGSVALWGDVVEGELGWRASTAYAQHLYVPLLRDGRDQALRAAEELNGYAVPVEVIEAPTPAAAVREIFRDRKCLRGRADRVD